KWSHCPQGIGRNGDHSRGGYMLLSRRRRRPQPTLFPYTTLFRSLFKSTDGGTTWRKIGKGLPAEGLGRIGLGIAPSLSKRIFARSEEHTSELQSRGHLVCRLLLEKKKNR